MQAAEIHSLFEIDLGASRRLQRPIPPMVRIDIVRARVFRV